MRFKGAGFIRGGWGEVEGQGTGVVLGSIECITEVHKEGVAAPAEAVLDVRVRELGSVEQVGGGYSDRVTAPFGQ